MAGSGMPSGPVVKRPLALAALVIACIGLAPASAGAKPLAGVRPMTIDQALFYLNLKLAPIGKLVAILARDIECEAGLVNCAVPMAKPAPVVTPVTTPVIKVVVPPVVVKVIPPVTVPPVVVVIPPVPVVVPIIPSVTIPPAATSTCSVVVTGGGEAQCVQTQSATAVG